MRPQSGQLRHKLTLQSTPLAVNPDAYGENAGEDQWSTVATCFGSVEPLSGMEAMNARQLKATVTHKIIVRNEGPVKPGDRYVFEQTNRYFVVESVLRMDERNAWYLIMATEYVKPQ